MLLKVADGIWQTRDEGFTTIPIDIRMCSRLQDSLEGLSDREVIREYKVCIHFHCALVLLFLTFFNRQLTEQSGKMLASGA